MNILEIYHRIVALTGNIESCDMHPANEETERLATEILAQAEGRTMNHTRFVQLPKTGTIMNKKETTLLEYMIAYLQEEVDRKNCQENWNDLACVNEFIEVALDAYAGGAR